MDPLNADNGRLLGEALLDVVLRWPKWVHRRVDSLHPLEGEWGRRRHSIDCQPPPDPRLIYNPDGLFVEQREEETALSIVPLLFMAKRPLRDFNIQSSDGTTIPILGTDETTLAGVLMMKRILENNKITVTPTITAALTAIAGPAITLVGPEVEEFLHHGRWNNVSCFDPRQLSENGRALIEVFASKFLLMALLPLRSTGVRQILKVSSYWQVEDSSKMGWLEKVAIAVGLKALKLSLPLEAPDRTRSYHLKVHTPLEAECLSLSLPKPDDFQENDTVSGLHGQRIDILHMPVAHVHGNYRAGTEIDDAELYLAVPRSGLQNTALMASFFTSVLMLLSMVLDDAATVWRENPGNAATALLTAPALLMTFLATKSESALLRGPLNLLREVIAFSGLTLFVVAASLIGELQGPYLLLLWWTITIPNLLISSLLLGCRIVNLWRERDRVNSTHGNQDFGVTYTELQLNSAERR